MDCFINYFRTPTIKTWFYKCAARLDTVRQRTVFALNLLPIPASLPGHQTAKERCRVNLTMAALAAFWNSFLQQSGFSCDISCLVWYNHLHNIFQLCADEGFGDNEEGVGKGKRWKVGVAENVSGNLIGDGKMLCFGGALFLCVEIWRDLWYYGIWNFIQIKNNGEVSGGI